MAVPRGSWPLIIAIPEALSDKLGPEGARALADLLNNATVQTRGDVIEIAANRFERAPAEETSCFGLGLAEDFAALRAQMHAIERRLLRLMFVLWITQIAAQAAILFAFFRP
jgi:hypothetical protein